ncbi:ATP-dependent dethiobiotin synthetase [Buchnera aphidicola (Nipponaphis monzeni)]|uniref:ATP-dependent dethiobiotin synthetase BioD n=1 Tax=Buchnera aphidicola (Nipponaphis monzeni) TaxID=2495405 RepID=A0A455TA83_9GAMM|nr:dethiobiotin synthase [Buchnera aphidicola]BBI01238.1 ATP-dependent dethiobiotin synthetase [Buchnera aphidicola (Nipponaphis monzeni)]
MKKNVWFITGTDTNVGKTVVSNCILRIGIQKGYKTVGYKPVSSSKTIDLNVKNKNEDIILLKQYSNTKLPDNCLNPFRFKQEGPPHLLSIVYNQPIELDTMSEKLNLIKSKANWIVIEGAGGWYTPLTNTTTFADWVNREKLSVILVVGIKLGCINHAILTQEAITKTKVNYIGWIANHIYPYNQFSQQYINTLKMYLKSCLLGEVPYFKKKICTNKLYKMFNSFINIF